MNNKFKVLENGIEKEYEIMKLCKNNNINYIIYKDKDDYYASKYNIINNEIILDEIDDDIEWDFIDKCLGEMHE